MTDSLNDGPINSGTRAFEPRSSAFPEGLILPHRYHPTGVIKLEPNQIVRIYVEGLVFDMDETLIEDSSKWIHDGIDASFHSALKKCFELQQVFGTPNAQQWEEIFVPLTGRSVVDNCRAMAAAASKIAMELGLETSIFDPFKIQEYRQEWVRDNLSSIAGKVKPFDGVFDLLESAVRQLVRMSLCTSTEEAVAKPLVQVYSIFNYIQQGVYAATKKLQDGSYCGESGVDACRAMNLSPSQCIMVGNAMSDYGCSSLAGMSACLMLFSGDNFEARYEKFMQEVYDFHEQRDFNNVTPVILFQNYNQIMIGGRGPARFEVLNRDDAL